MNNLATLIALLKALNELLALITSNPSLHPEIKANAIRLAERALIVAQNSIKNQKSYTIYEKNKIVPKPNYDLFSLENKINEMINQERNKLGLNPLMLDENLSRIARKHSEDQAETNRLTTSMEKPCSYPMIRHEGLKTDSFTLADRLYSAAIPFRRAGENIALLSTAKDFMYSAFSEVTCPTITLRDIPKNATFQEAKKIILYNIESAQIALEKVPNVKWVNQDWLDLDTIAQRAVSGWIESPGHFANITNENFTRTGIGAVEVNRYIIITQIFIEPR